MQSHTSCIADTRTRYHVINDTSGFSVSYGVKPNKLKNNNYTYCDGNGLIFIFNHLKRTTGVNYTE